MFFAGRQWWWWWWWFLRKKTYVGSWDRTWAESANLHSTGLILTAVIHCLDYCNTVTKTFHSFYLTAVVTCKDFDVASSAHYLVSFTMLPMCQIDIHCIHSAASNHLTVPSFKASTVGQRGLLVACAKSGKHCLTMSFQCHLLTRSRTDWKLCRSSTHSVVGTLVVLAAVLIILTRTVTRHWLIDLKYLECISLTLNSQITFGSVHACLCQAELEQQVLSHKDVQQMLLTENEALRQQNVKLHQDLVWNGILYCNSLVC